MNKIIYVIILNWNGESDTIACLDSIISNTKECDYNIILVDNGSEISGINALRDFCNNNFNSFLEVEKENIIAQQEFILKKIMVACFLLRIMKILVLHAVTM